ARRVVGPLRVSIALGLLHVRGHRDVDRGDEQAGHDQHAEHGDHREPGLRLGAAADRRERLADDLGANHAHCPKSVPDAAAFGGGVKRSTSESVTGSLALARLVFSYDPPCAPTRRLTMTSAALAASVCDRPDGVTDNGSGLGSVVVPGTDAVPSSSIIAWLPFTSVYGS